LSGILLLAIVVLGALLWAIPTTHTYIASDTHTAALLRNSTAEGRALGQAWELLGAKDGEVERLDFHPEVKGTASGVGKARGDDVGIRGIGIFVLILLCLLVEVECQPVTAFVAHRQVREEEVASLIGPVKVSHARDRHTRQNRRLVGSGRLDAAMGHDPSMFKRRKQEEIGIVQERDVLLLGFLPRIALEDPELDHGRWINRTTIGRS
jgi:hypothetical protein